MLHVQEEGNNFKNLIQSVFVAGFFLATAGFMTVSTVQAQDQDSSKKNDKPAIKVGEKTMSHKKFNKQVEQRMKQMKKMPGQKKKNPDELRKKVKKEVKDQSISRLVLELHAEKSGLSVSDSEFQERWDQYVKRMGSEKKLKKRLKKVGVKVKDFRENLKNELLIQKYIDQELPEITVSDEEAKSFYEKNKKRFKNAGFKKMKGRIKSRLKRQKERKKVKDLTKKLRKETKVEVNL